MKGKLLLVLIGVCVLLVVVLATGAWLITPRYERVVETHVKVADYIGINVDDDKLYFGANNPGGGGRRDVFITSGEEAFVMLRTGGDMAGWLWLSEDRFLISPGEERGVTVHLRIPEEAAYGNYTGAVVAEFYRPAARVLLG
ncbi:hypothetical protein JXA12_05700 [Candidatus Woesearchaeota archaeon]|nr:hypothetical protein [Candidatus Woesearchaeota archaeon]